MSKEKDDFIARSKEYWNPGKTSEWQRMGVDLVIDRREAYYLWDVDGRRLIDVHLNGGTYSLDVFQAERHTIGSNFRITTSLALNDAPASVPEPASLALVGSRWPFHSSTLARPIAVMAAIMRSMSKARKL